jgi:exportin-2 (importin alpha re-exporter)
MQTSKTDKYAYLFVYFLLFSMAVNVDGLTPDFTVGAVEEIQPGYAFHLSMAILFTDIHHLSLWSQILSNFVIQEVTKMPTKDRKVAAVGLTRLLTQSEVMRREPAAQQW